jgi:hypothetical protein
LRFERKGSRKLTAQGSLLSSHSDRILLESASGDWGGSGDGRPFVRPFRYALDPLCLSACLCYAINRWLIKPVCTWPFLHDHFNAQQGADSSKSGEDGGGHGDPSCPVSLGMQGLVVDLFFNKFRGSLRLFHCAETSRTQSGGSRSAFLNRQIGNWLGVAYL